MGAEPLGAHSFLLLDVENAGFLVPFLVNTSSSSSSAEALRTQATYSYDFFTLLFPRAFHRGKVDLAHSQTASLLAGLNLPAEARFVSIRDTVIVRVEIRMGEFHVIEA